MGAAERAPAAGLSLNPAQLQAVEAGDGPLLILAGAGTGKTKTLTARVAHLLATGRAEARNVLAITFTNKAAAELAQRVRATVGDQAAVGMTIGTFHSVLHRHVVRPHAERLGRTASFSIYDSHDLSKVLREAIAAAELAGIEQHEVARWISLAKSRLLDPDALRTADVSQFAEEVARCYEQLERLLASYDALDFDDLICRSAWLLQRDRRLLAAYQARWRHVLIDEYQDTNPAQYAVVRSLAGEAANITACGDPDQAIYRFRGAEVRNILAFTSDYPDARVVSLMQNYRSSEQIVLAASSVVRENPHPDRQPLQSERGPGPLVQVVPCEDEREEAIGAMRWVRSLIRRGVDPGEIAILYRTQEQRRYVEPVLLGAQIPYRVLGGSGFFESKEVRDVLAHLQLVVNPRDAVAFGRALAVRKGIGDRAVEAVAEHARRKSVDLLAACRDAKAAEGLRGSQPETVIDFGQTLYAIRDLREQDGLAATVTSTVMASGLPARLNAQRDEGAAKRLERLRDLVRAARAHAQADSDASVESFLAHAALIQADGDEEAAKVALATVHASKGLEFDAVRVIGLEEHLFPHTRAIGTKAGLEEERRLCYVAMTRAKRWLCLSYANARGRRPRARSRFLKEARLGPQASNGGDIAVEP